jgi:hypothetical protein
MRRFSLAGLVAIGFLRGREAPSRLPPSTTPEITVDSYREAETRSGSKRTWFVQ